MIEEQIEMHYRDIAVYFGLGERVEVIAHIRRADVHLTRRLLTNILFTGTIDFGWCEIA